MQFMQRDFLPAVLVNNCDLSDGDTTLKVLVLKCSREDTNATISALA